jgi:hypothetical protein
MEPDAESCTPTSPKHPKPWKSCTQKRILIGEAVRAIPPIEAEE